MSALIAEMAAKALKLNIPLSVQLDLTYKRPSEKTKIHRYLFDAFGPYPIVGSAITAGIARFMILPRSGGKAQWVIAGDTYPTGV